MSDPIQTAQPQQTQPQQELRQKDAKRREFILNGNLWQVILLISLPLMLINALNFAYTIIDSIFAAEIGKNELSAVAILSQVNSMLASLGGGLAAGGMIIVSRLVGRGDMVTAKRAANTLVLLSVIIALLVVAIILPLTQPILELSGMPKAQIEVGTPYFIVLTMTSAVTLFNSIFLGLEKSRGRTRNVLLTNLTVMIIKTVLCYIFIYVLHIHDLMFIAMSTLIANLTLACYAIVMYILPGYSFRFSIRNTDLSAKFLLPIAVIAFPIFLSRFIFSLGKVIINSLSKHYGDTVPGALGVSNNMGGFTTNVLSSVEETISLVVSTNLGAKNPKRAIRAFYFAAIINLAIACTGVLIMTIFNDGIVGWYARGDAEYGKMISDIFAFEKMGIITLSINSSVLGLLYGFGFTRTSMIISLSRLFVFRIPSLLFMIHFTNYGYESVGIAMFVSNTGIGLMSLIIGAIYLRIIKTKKISDTLKIG